MVASGYQRVRGAFEHVAAIIFPILAHTQARCERRRNPRARVLGLIDLADESQK